MNWSVPLADLDYGEEEEAAVLAVLRSKWLTMGEVTQQFENQFANLTGCKHAFAVSNATLGLHLACTALGLGPGDEIIVPALTFVATANAVLYTGADVKFADILGPEELTIDPAEIERTITPNTKAIIVMHYGGFPCRMSEIMAIAPGGFLNNRALGSWGSIGVFSFFSNKNLSTGEGGMVVTNSDELADHIRLQRSHGMTSLTYDRHKGHAFSYDVVTLGYNYRIDEIRSALGLVQFQKLERNNNRRRELTYKYWRELDSLGIGLPFSQSNQGKPSYHIFPILLPPGCDRHVFMTSLRDDGIQSSIHYTPIHEFTYYRQRYGQLSLPRTESIAACEVTLPLYPTMSDDQINLVVEAVNRALKAAKKT
jgi:dTDP-4-amino-4,6-dideoxygalactose transaminase